MKKILATFIVSIVMSLFLLASSYAQNQYNQIGGKYSSNIQLSAEGSSIKISDDGITAVVGSPGSGNGAGAISVFTFSGSNWVKTESNLVGTGALSQSSQGTTVDISGNGKTIIVGSGHDNGVWIYTFTGSNWVQAGNKIVPLDLANSLSPETNAAISTDGKTIIIGNSAFSNGSVKGAGWVFTFSGGNWTQVGNRLTVNDATLNPELGSSVAISSDGNTVVMGGKNDNSGVGATWVFTYNGSNFIQSGNKLVGSGYVRTIGSFPNVLQGTSVDISGDGKTIVTGGYYDNVLVGAAWVFTCSGGSWTQVGSKLVGSSVTGCCSYQGFSVGISNNGRNIIIGGYRDNGQYGAAWVYTFTGSNWMQLGSKLIGTGSINSNPNQGYSVSISGDGKIVLSGANAAADNYSGAFWSFGLNYTNSVLGINTDDLTENNLIVFPNPFSDTFEINLLYQYKYLLYDITGNLVFDSDSNNSSNVGSQILPGLYLLNILPKDKAPKVIKMLKSNSF